MNAQRQMKWLIKRELWEHKGGMVYAPLIVGLITLILTIVSTSMAGWDVVVMGVHGTDLGTMVIEQAQKNPTEAAHWLSRYYPLMGLPAFIPLGFVVFFYALFNLVDERKDRSVLFWKSLPISDELTIASKAVTALIIAPLITVGVGWCTGLMGLILALSYASFHGAHLWMDVFGQQVFYLVAFELLNLVPVYALMALPTVGWLMLMSASTRSPFLWGVVMPVALMVGLALGGWDRSSDTFWVVEGIKHLLGGAFPFIHLKDILADHQASGSWLSTLSWMTLEGSTWMWAGVGVIMLYGASLVRKRKGDVG